MESKNIHFRKMPLIMKIEPVMTRMQWSSLYDHVLLTLIRILKFFIKREEKSSSHDRNREKVIFCVQWETSGTKFVHLLGKL